MVGKKRSRKAADAKASSPGSDSDQKQPFAKKTKEDDMPKSKHLNVPIDEGCQLAGSHRVYIDEDGTIYDASLNQTNSGNNNNKFYRIQLLESGNNYHTWTRWGRVGEHGQNALLGNGSLDDAIKQYEKKFKDKSGHKWANRFDEPKKGKYSFIERNYEPDSEDDPDKKAAEGRRGSKTSQISQASSKIAESKLLKPVQQLMELIFNQQYFAATMSDMSYDANKLPLGKLSKRTLMSGFEKLKELAELLADSSLASNYSMTYSEAVEELSNRYYTIIPHSFGRNRPPIIQHDVLLKREIQLLESLSDMEIANEIMKDAVNGDGEVANILDSHYTGLRMQEMTPLDDSSSEYKELQDYLLKTHGQTHNIRMQVQNIFRIERQGESERFSQSPYGKMKGDRRLLWHGSRTTNFGGILSQGLRIAPPEAPVSGYMFGKGVYLADISSKSANYCYSPASGNIGLLLLCEAELGNPMLELTDASSGAAEEAKRQGCHATWGKGLTAPQGWKDASCVNKALKGVKMPDTSKPPGKVIAAGVNLLYNEFICYDVAQIRLRYLFRVEMK